MQVPYLPYIFKVGLKVSKGWNRRTYLICKLPKYDNASLALMGLGNGIECKTMTRKGLYPILYTK